MSLQRALFVGGWGAGEWGVGVEGVVGVVVVVPWCVHWFLHMGLSGGWLGRGGGLVARVLKGVFIKFMEVETQKVETNIIKIKQISKLFQQIIKLPWLKMNFYLTQKSPLPPSSILLPCSCFSFLLPPLFFLHSSPPPLSLFFFFFFNLSPFGF